MYSRISGGEKKTFVWDCVIYKFISFNVLLQFIPGGTNSEKKNLHLCTNLLS